jgi:hypothetical protein
LVVELVFESIRDRIGFEKPGKRTLRIFKETFNRRIGALLETIPPTSKAELELVFVDEYLYAVPTTLKEAAKVGI